MGVDISEKPVGGTYLQLDSSVIHTYVAERSRK